jgi:menaquinone-dependent protoporphyrinogen oxidase
MATTLREHGIDVDVTQPEDIVNVSWYSGFVLGSGLYLGRWLPGAEHFVEEYADQIRQRPTWLFSSGQLGEAKPAEPIHADVLERLMAQTGAIEHHLFGGRLVLDHLNRTERFIARWVGAGDCDHRDWDEIERWTAHIADELHQRVGAA